MKFVIFFVHQHLDFRIQELESVLLLRGIDLKDCVDKVNIDLKSPLLEINLPSEGEAKFLCRRCILVKGIYELWGIGKDYNELVKNVEELPSEMKNPFYADDLTWRIDVEGFGRKYSLDQQEYRRNQFSSVLPFRGDVNLKDPINKFLILEEIGVTEKERSQEPKRIFFLREIAGGAKNRGRGGGRDLVDRQTLKKREYIGPTSMDNELSLIMANMGLVEKGSLVLDPFVGTGSLLVAAGTFGAFCFGTDIDHRILHGKGGKNVHSNFKQYGLSYPELIRCDNSLPSHIQNSFFDAIICDPPYGIRAGARKSGTRLEINQNYVDQYINPRIPRTQIYEAEDVMLDLLNLAARVLVLNGRLVYLLPTTYDYTEDDLPSHPCLQVIANSEQPLSSKYARRLITMIKIKEYNEDELSAGFYGKKKEGFSFAKLREKIFS